MGLHGVNCSVLRRCKFYHNVLYNGVPTGILDQRDNAQTGDLTASIVANFRTGGGSVTNNSPVFASDPIVKPDATQGQNYSSSLFGDASDPDGNPLTFAKIGGPAWLIVDAGGGLSGTPGASNVGLNSFTVGASDGRGGSVSTTLQINVVSSMIAPTHLAATAVGSKRIHLTWSDNSSAETGFRIYRSGNGVSFSKIATVGAGVTSFSNTGFAHGQDLLLSRARLRRQDQYRILKYRERNGELMSYPEAETARVRR